MSGEVISVWSAFATVFAAYEPQSGKESQTEDQEQAFNTARFRIRYLSGVVPKMRILFDGRYFDIEAINDVGGRRKQLHIMAREHV
ncbi:MAG: phage head closure protein [Ketobacter sp.]|nr:phage head closure protein [Ketobacter sp.]